VNQESTWCSRPQRYRCGTVSISMHCGKGHSVALHRRSRTPDGRPAMRSLTTKCPRTVSKSAEADIIISLSFPDPPNLGICLLGVVVNRMPLRILITWSM
jgi:hypothetical protein